MSGEQFYINYSLNGEHYAMGPYHTRRFAMSHIEDVRRQSGASNVYLGNKPPDDKSYRKLVPITMAIGAETGLAKRASHNGSPTKRNSDGRMGAVITRLLANRLILGIAVGHEK
jgi:hypothetical protein